MEAWWGREGGGTGGREADKRAAAVVRALHTSLSLEMEGEGQESRRWLHLQDSAPVGYLGEEAAGTASGFLLGMVHWGLSRFGLEDDV